MKKIQNKVIITSNPLNHEGGVVNYYNLFFENFNSDDFSLIHVPVGSRMKFFYSSFTKKIVFPFYFFLDIINYLSILVRDRSIRIVQISPSLMPIPLLRDFFFLIFAKFFKKKTIVFFRGWKLEIFNSIKSSKVYSYIFLKTYGNADSVFVLASSIKRNLETLGWDPKNIKISTTAINKNNIIVHKNRKDKKCVKFIYVGRLSRLKGSYELIKAFSLLNSKKYTLELLVVGHADGKLDLEHLKSYFKKHNSQNKIKFLGHVSGQSKYRLLSDSDLYIFPSYTEGCPTSVLEALASGLFVISTNVGALKELIYDNQNGLIVEKENARDLKEKMCWALNNIETIRSKKEEIMKNAIIRFDIESITNQFNKHYCELIS